MNTPMEMKLDPTNGQYYVDFDWNQWVDRLFNLPPQDPFTFSLTFLSVVNRQQLIELLAQALMNGVKIKYNKELASLTESEIEEVQKYFHSFGYHILYKVNTSMEYVENLHKMAPVNRFQIDFQPYPQKFNKLNQPERLI